MALYIPHRIFHLARLLYVRPENFGPYYVPTEVRYQLHCRALNYLTKLHGLCYLK